MPQKLDRRVHRSQQLIRNALFSLIQEKGFEAISVQDIIDRADVGRATFYAHFDSKEDLLVSGFEHLRERLKGRQQQARSALLPQDRVFAFSYELFAHADEFRQLFRAMVGKHSGAIVQRTMQKLLLDLIRDEVTQPASRGVEMSIPSQALAQFIAGGLFGLLVWWLNDRSPISVEEVNAMFRKLAIPAFRAQMAK